jgi:hypothetical protein
VVGESDRRKRSLKLTLAGERMLARLKEPARRAQQRVLSAFAPRERKMFLDLLDKFARTFNDVSRVPQVVQDEAATLQNPKGRKRRPASS